MINRDELVPIGKFRKPHGIKGEITLTFSDIMASVIYPQPDPMPGLAHHPLFSQCPFLICELDGIFVPFRIENYRFISNSTAYIQLKNIDSDRKVRLLSHKEVYFPAKYIQEEVEDDSFTWDYFIGFTLTDERLGEIGSITAVDKSTINTLFVVEKEKEEILIPAVEEFIVRIDENKKELIVTLPEGLVE